MLDAPTSVDPAAAVPRHQAHDSYLYVVGDIHGHHDILHAALQAAGLVTTSGDWCGGQTRLWFLGDLVDRGPDGLAVLDLVHRLGIQASQVGGQVATLLGNHEILLMGARYFGNAVATNAPRGFLDHWLINGGRHADFTGITDRHLAWLHGRPVLALVDDHLLLHADTTAYLDYGDTIDQINHQIRTILAGRRIDDWWTCFRQVTRREEFAGKTGIAAAQEIHHKLGGKWIVHGHTPIAHLRNIQPSDITAVHTYADGSVVATDSALYEGGPCLITQLPLIGSTNQR